MAGKPGSGGPIPKRASQRRNRGQPAIPVTRAPAGKATGRPATNGKWHPVAKRFYNSLGDSGQSVFYQASDWAFAYLIAEAISRELSPRKVFDRNGQLVEEATFPPKASAIAAWTQAASLLLVTEADRRRMRIELERDGVDQDDEPTASVTYMEDLRNRLGFTNGPAP